MSVAKRPLISVLLISLWLGFSFLAAAAEPPLTLEIQLVWGTNEDNVEDKDLYELPKEIIEPMESVFKWKQYYGVQHKGVKKHVKTVVDAKKTLVKVSEKCRLELKKLTEGRIEVKVFGKNSKGKETLVVTKRQKVVPNELFVVGGDCEKGDNTAWFVLMKPLKERE